VFVEVLTSVYFHRLLSKLGSMNPFDLAWGGVLKKATLIPTLSFILLLLLLQRCLFFLLLHFYCCCHANNWYDHCKYRYD
jgi:hypothetical protein